ncbi:putative hydrolase [Vibrio maritimus]|uniref:Putative hydrolase n=1 Tax=Vibrio maritimus TaxID=990268 RepID=A0A090U327_9VIBR|nr:putative hydrolase [Vibrio maritimus]
MNRNMTSMMLSALLLQGCGIETRSEVVEQKYTNHASKYVTVDGKRVHYRDEGQGEVVILLHGTSSSLHAWDQWTQILKQDYRVVRMDLPGFGLTGHLPENRYEIVDDIAFLSAFTKQLNIEQAHFVGSSLGGRIGWEYSIEYPEKIKSLTLINALGYPQQSWPPAIEMAQWPVIDRIMEHVTPRFMFSDGLKEVYFDQQLVDAALIDRYYELTTYQDNRQGFTRRVKASLDEDSDKIKKYLHRLLFCGAWKIAIFLLKMRKSSSEILRTLMLSYLTTLDIYQWKRYLNSL